MIIVRSPLRVSFFGGGTDYEKWFLKNKPDVVIISAAKVGGIYANSNYSFDFILQNLKIQIFINIIFKNE